MPDASAGPTYPYEGPFNPPPGGGGSEGEAAITLSANDSGSLEIGDEFTLDITINTFDNEVDTYTVVITYDAEMLEVSDADSASSGTQINYLNSIFPSTENSVAVSGSTGTITISGDASDPLAFSRRIAEVTFTARASGNSNIAVVRAQSNVLTADGTDILVDTGSESITVQQQSSSSTSTSTSTTTSSVSSTTSTSSFTPVSTSTTTTSLPDSGIINNTAIGSVTVGILLVVAGSVAVLKKNKRKLWEE